MATIHPTALVDSHATLAADVDVGAYAIIGPDVTIGAGTVVQEHAYIKGHTTIGQRCQIFPFACIGMKTQDLKFKDENVTYVEIGDETILREFSTVHLGTQDGEVTKIGSNCLIMAYCHVAHGCVVGNHVIMSNEAALSGEITVEDYAIIGGKTGVHQGVRIGQHAMVGGASKIRQDVPPYMIVDAVDGVVRVIGPNVVGLQRSGATAQTRTTIKEAYRFIYREGLNRSQALERVKYDVDDIPEIRNLIAFYQNSKRGVL